MIVPLTKRKKDGTLIERSGSIGSLLARLDELPRDELIERARIRDRNHADYVPSECVLHLVCGCRRDNSEAWFEGLYKILQERVRRLAPTAEEGGGGASLTRERIRDAVFSRFDELLAADRWRPGD